MATFTAAAFTADDNTAMAFYTAGTEGGDDYEVFTGLVWSDEDALTTYIDTLEDAEAIEALEEYTDGYAVAVQITQAAALWNVSGFTGACVGGTNADTDEADDDGDAEDDAEADETIVTAASCFTITRTWTDDAVEYIQGQYYSTTSMTETNLADNTVYTYLPTGDLTPGFDQTWACEYGVAEGGAAASEDVTTTCGRFLPAYSSEGYDADDLRFDDDIEGGFGYITQDGFSYTITWIVASDDTYEWEGAFQAVTMAGAAALVALVF